MRRNTSGRSTTDTGLTGWDRQCGADVLLVVSHLGPGGTQRVVCNLANEWTRQGYRVRMLLMNAQRSNAVRLDPGVEIEYLIHTPPSRSVLNLKRLYARALWVWQLRRLIRGSGAPTVVSFIRSTNAQVLLACLGLRRPRIVVCERNDPARQRIPQPWDVLSRLLYRTADVVTANSRGVVPTLEKFAPRSKIFYVPNILVAPGAERVQRGAPTIIAGGRLVPQKALDVLLRGFAAVKDDLAGWRIALLGQGPAEQSLRHLADELGVADRIDWLGHVPEPYAYFRAADMFALPSWYEGMPNCLLEAMACKLPVVVSDASPGPLEVVADGRTGLVVASGDAEAWGEALRRLARDPDLRARLGTAAASAVAPFHAGEATAVWTAIAGLSPTGSSDGLGESPGSLARRWKALLRGKGVRA